jgi:tRNA(Ile)-lysidine synthase
MILDQVKKTIEQWRLLKKGDKVLIACSGGADSTALIALFLDLRQEYELEVALAHLNHLLRRRAAEDEQFVIGLARKHNLPLYLRREDVRAYAKEHGLNIEEAGRKRRYDFLKNTAARIHAAKIATGHTMTDQAETVLIRLLRGSGSRGLGGISPVVDDLIIRPLIELEHQEVEAYLRAKRLAFRTDESNLDRRYLRNRVRLELIPYLQKNYEPSVVQQLSRLAEIIRGEDDFLQNAVQAKMHQALIKKKEKLYLDAAALSSLPPALARRCVRDFLTRVKGDLRRISFRNVESVLSLKEQQQLHLPGNLILGREGGHIFLRERAQNHISYEYSWNGQEGLNIKELGLRFAGRKTFKGAIESFLFDDERRAYLDWSKLYFPLTIRSRRPGDVYRPLGTPGRKKLKEIMRAKGIPLGHRQRLPVFLSRGTIVWVLGLPAAEEFKVGAGTREIFIIEKTV